MDLDLVGYLFGLLDPADRERTEAVLRADPTAQANLDRLRVNLAPLTAARGDELPPIGLADRTIALVTRHANNGRPVPSHRPVLGTDREPAFAPSRWGRVDVLIAASILIVVGGLGVSGIGRVQKQRAQITCQNNLRELHHGLAEYSLAHDGRFPQIVDRPPNNVARAFVPMLQDAGYLSPAGLPACPMVTVAENEPNAGGYAYSLGVRGPDGQLEGLRRTDADLLPIAADQPVPVSHGAGHNVLFVGGNVRFTTSPNVGVGGDHIFLNQAGIVAAGLNLNDTVLAGAHSSP
jgi:hypothetical protein